ncbi:MAG: glycine--tRNA ligase [Patescibacteria group bacterium]
MAEVQKTEVTMEKIVSLAKRRGFVFPGSEIYGGLANSWDYGPYGAQLKKNIKDHWWKFFVESRDDMVGLEAALIMNPKTWEASGHIGNFSDPLAECKKCHERVRADQVPLASFEGIDFNDENQTKEHALFIQTWATNPARAISTYPDSAEKYKWLCPNCKFENKIELPKSFNLMLKTQLGATEDTSNEAYLRPETAQAMFIDFPAVQQMSRKKLPFGIAQSGKAFRNEITPGNFIFRTREFDLMEFEYFFDPQKSDWNTLFEEWKQQMEQWMGAVGIDSEKTHAVEIPDGERAHYSKRTIDFEFDYPFGQKELFGLAYRGDYDLAKHEEVSGKELRYIDPETSEKILPHVIEPAFGADRAMLAIMLSAYEEEEVKEGDIRTVLRFKPIIAPVQVAVFPLMKNKEELVGKAREVYESLRKDLRVEFDDNGNVGKRYRRQDEIGTPYCITIDFDTLEDDTVTVRDRDTMEQTRIKVSELQSFLGDKLQS